jgi:hypothetical protein
MTKKSSGSRNPSCPHTISRAETGFTADRKSRPVKSKYILIRGSAPVLELEPIPEFSVPGTFQYQIKAIDPDVLPGEEPALSFELVSPRDLGITLDPQTGQMKWELSEETIKKLKEKIEIKFKVIKKGAPEVQSSITLTFSDTGEEGQQTGETESGSFKDLKNSIFSCLF